MDIWLQTEKPVVDTKCCSRTCINRTIKQNLLMQNITVEEPEKRMDQGKN